MANKNKLKKLFGRLQEMEKALPTGDARNYLDQILKEETERFQSSFKDNPTVKYLDQINTKLEKFKKTFNLGPVITTIENIQSDIAESKDSINKEIESIRSEQESKFKELNKLISTSRSAMERMTSGEVKSLIERINKIQGEISYQTKDSEKKGQSIKSVIEGLDGKITTLFGGLAGESVARGDLVKSVDSRFTEKENRINQLISELQSLRSDTFSRLETIGRGGAMNRQINVKSSVMSSKYTDINFANGGGITWTATDDTTNKRVNITASITSSGGGGTPGGSDTQIQFNDGGSFGGDPALTWASSVFTVGQQGSVYGRIDLAGATTGTVRLQTASVAGNWTLTLPSTDGSANQVLTTDGNGISRWASVAAAGGSGITRSVSIITANTTAGDTASTDYVYFANAGMVITLPTAVGNSNQYTVKNNSGSSVLVSAAAGEDIDGSTTALLPTENESLSFISNNSVWGVV